MVQNQKFRELALSFPGAVEAPHFENHAFKVNKKIFATLNEKEKKACLKLNEIDQNVFSLVNKSIIYPVPNKWGKHGWTFVELSNVKMSVLKDALTSAFCEVAPKRLSQQFKKEED